jgi:hypothetical protein
MSGIFSAELHGWTVTACMGELLERAEQLFGKRVKEWTPLGVQIGNGEEPALMPLGDTDKRYISLSRGVDNMGDALFETAHEVIHLLGPVPAANALEEGVAAWFSVHYDCPQIPAPSRDLAFLETHRPRYGRAYHLYQDFRTGGGDIKVLRTHEPYISRATPELLKHCAPKCDDDTIAAFLGPI